jgi:hypothetical protein
MSHLDVNRNGTIEFGEFLHWIARECGLSTSERDKKREKSDLHNRLQTFVMSLRAACKMLLTEKRTIENKLIPLENGTFSFHFFFSFSRIQNKMKRNKIKLTLLSSFFFFLLSSFFFLLSSSRISHSFFSISLPQA